MERIKKWCLSEFWVGYSLFDKMFMALMLLVQIAVFFVAPTNVVDIVLGCWYYIGSPLCKRQDFLLLYRLYPNGYIFVPGVAK